MPILEASQKRMDPNDVLRMVIDDATCAQDERRRNGRIPFFQPAILELADSRERFTIFTRDVSAVGIGLLHSMPVPPQDVTLIVNVRSDQIVRLDVEILWCVASGGGWYISGSGFKNAEFVNLPEMLTPI